MSTQSSARIICHSANPLDQELITMEIECHRFILPEFNTHRTFSRNFQSSRAIPVKRMIEMIRKDPAYPVYWGTNQAGMVAAEELIGEELIAAKTAWQVAMLQATEVAEQLADLNVHKQVTNRLVEPFMWQKGVVTATREAYEAFFKLRSHYQAQPEIKALSDAMMAALAESEPDQLDWDQWHMPYVKTLYKFDRASSLIEGYGEQQFYAEDGTELSLEGALMISASCCGQVSYRRLDDSLEKAEFIFEKLNLDAFNDDSLDPPHASPAEHSAMCLEDKGSVESSSPSGNFVGNWYQYRKMLEVNDARHLA